MISSLWVLLSTLLISVLMYRAFILFLKSSPETPVRPAPHPIAMLILYIFVLAGANFLGTLALITTLVTLRAGNFNLECVAEKSSWVLINPSCLGGFFPFAVFIASLVGGITGIVCFILAQRRLVRHH